MTTESLSTQGTASARKLTILSAASAVGVMAGLSALHQSWVVPSIEQEVRADVQAEVERAMERQERLAMELIKSIQSRLDRIEERMNAEDR